MYGEGKYALYVRQPLSYARDNMFFVQCSVNYFTIYVVDCPLMSILVVSILCVVKLCGV